MKTARWLMLALLIWVTGAAIWIASGPAEDAVAQADVAIILGAAVTGDEPTPVFRERINHAVRLKRAGRVKHLLFTGGKSPEDSLSEAEAARDYAIAAGIAPADVLIETNSRTTYQNLSEARAIMRSAGLESAIIVSDPLHLQRALQMAEGLDMQASASATPTTRYRSLSTQAPFLMREVYFLHHYWLFGE